MNVTKEGFLAALKEFGKGCEVSTLEGLDGPTLEEIRHSAEQISRLAEILANEEKTSAVHPPFTEGETSRLEGFTEDPQDNRY
jgi:hypothetical protein